MNDNGDYIVVTHNNFIATRYKDLELIRSANCGRILSANITNEGALVSFVGGVKGYCVPTEVKASLRLMIRETETTPSLIRFTDGGAYLFANEDSYSSYL